MRLEGIVVPLITPLTERGVNEDAIATLVGTLLRAGVHGLFAGGTTGEGPLLSIEERRAALRATRRAARASRCSILKPAMLGGTRTASSSIA